jgi:hypothetical protein
MFQPGTEVAFTKLATDYLFFCYFNCVQSASALPYEDVHRSVQSHIFVLNPLGVPHLDYVWRGTFKPKLLVSFTLFRTGSV